MASDDNTVPQSAPPRDGEDAKTITSTTPLVDSTGAKDTTSKDDSSPSPILKPHGSPVLESSNPNPQPPIPADGTGNEKATATPQTELASTSTPAPQLQLQVPKTAQTYINFLFLSGRKRLMNFDPDTTIGRVKELVWAAWSAQPNDTVQPGQEIEERPPAPSYLRVLHLGRMLQDDETLRDLKLPTHLPTSTPVNSPVTPGGASHGHAPVSTIMHLSIRPFPPPGEADSGKKSGRAFGRGSDRTNNGGAPDPGENANTGCCGCVIC